MRDMTYRGGCLARASEPNNRFRGPGPSPSTKRRSITVTSSRPFSNVSSTVQLENEGSNMSEAPQTDVSRRAALPTASLLPRSSQPTIDQNSAEYLDAIEEEWNKKVDVEIETLVDGMVDIVSLASVRGDHADTEDVV